MGQEQVLHQQLADLNAEVESLRAELLERPISGHTLADSDALLRIALAGSRAGFLEWRPRPGDLRFDDHLKALLGFPQGPGTDPPAPQEYLERVVHPADRDVLPLLLPVDASAVQSRDPVEFRIIAPDGEEQYLEAHIRHEIDGAGATTRVLCLCRDISARKRAEHQVQEHTKRLQEAEELALVGRWWWDVHNGDVTWSDQVYRIFQLDPESFVPQIDSILALSPWPEDNARDQELIQKAIESRQRGSYEQRFLRPDGTTGYYQSTFVGIYDGDELVAMRGTVQDISDRKLTELAHRRNEENLRVTLDSIGDAVIATDKDGRITRMNPVSEHLTGWTTAEARGRPLLEVFQIINAHTRKTAENPVAKVLETNLVVGLANHTVLVARDGTEYQIADSGAPIRSTGGETVGVVLVFRDVTQQHALEDRLRQSEKMQAIGRLAGGVAHDFNNLLTGLIGSTELLHPHLPDHAEARELHSTILQCAEQAAGLTSKLLTFARHQPSTKAVMDVHTALHDALGILRYAVNSQLSVDTQLDAQESLIEGDPTQVQNAFLNLGINAAQAMPEGGSLFVTSRSVTLDEADCRDSEFSLQPGRHIAIKVRDTGEGIPADIVGRIFEPFFSTKAPGEGTGLGMAAVWGTVQDCGGSIRVESQLGIGTEFSIMLPVSSGATEIPLEPAEVTPGRGLILVVDDEPLVRAIAEAFLRSFGYDVLVADGGQAAVSLFEQHHKRVALVLLDMVMPGMDGRACFAALRAIDPRAKVVLSSGFAHENDVDVLRSKGLIDLVRKPYRAATLSQVVHDAITKS